MLLLCLVAALPSAAREEEISQRTPRGLAVYPPAPRIRRAPISTGASLVASNVEGSSQQGALGLNALLPVAAGLVQNALNSQGISSDNVNSALNLFKKENIKNDLRLLRRTLDLGIQAATLVNRYLPTPAVDGTYNPLQKLSPKIAFYKALPNSSIQWVAVKKPDIYGTLNNVPERVQSIVDYVTQRPLVPPSAVASTTAEERDGNFSSISTGTTGASAGESVPVVEDHDDFGFYAPSSNTVAATDTKVKRALPRTDVRVTNQQVENSISAQTHISPRLVVVSNKMQGIDNENMVNATRFARNYLSNLELVSEDMYGLSTQRYDKPFTEAVVYETPRRRRPGIFPKNFLPFEVLSNAIYRISREKGGSSESEAASDEKLRSPATQNHAASTPETGDGDIKDPTFQTYGAPVPQHTIAAAGSAYGVPSYQDSRIPFEIPLLPEYGAPPSQTSKVPFSNTNEYELPFTQASTVLFSNPLHQVYNGTTVKLSSGGRRDKTGLPLQNPDQVFSELPHYERSSRFLNSDTGTDFDNAVRYDRAEASTVYRSIADLPLEEHVELGRKDGILHDSYGNPVNGY